MFWNKLRRWLTGLFANQRSANFDRALVKKMQARRLPSWRQFTYLNQFLSVKEKRALAALLALVLVTALTWAGTALARHLGTGPKAGGDYSEGLVGEIKYINPLFANANDTDADVTALVYNGLFAYDHTGTLVPLLAKSYTVSSDGKVYDIALRTDVVWSDKEQFSANDVLYTFETIQNPEVGSSLLPTFQGVKVEKTGTNTIRFTLKEPFAPFLSSLTVGILPEHVWSEIPPASLRLAKNNLQPVGTGAWLFQKLTKDDLGNIQSYALVRNENYFGAKPFLKTVTFKFFSDYGQAVEALRGQTISGLAFVPISDKNKLASKNLANYFLKLPEYTALFFNQTKQPLLKNDDLRAALTQAINKDQVVAKALGGAGEPIFAPSTPGLLGYNPNGKHLNFDIDAANARLDKTWPRIEPEEYFKIRHEALIKALTITNSNTKNASATPPEVTAKTLALEKQITDIIHKEMAAGQLFYRKDKAGNVLSLVITTADAPPYPATAELVAAAWRAIGVQTSWRAVGARQIGRESIKPRDYQVLLYSEIMGGDPDLYPFWHSSQATAPGLNLSLYSSHAADTLLEDARATTDNSKRADLYQKFQDQLNSDSPAIFLYAPYYTFAVSKQVKGINFDRLTSPPDRFQDLNNWYVKTTWAWK